MDHDARVTTFLRAVRSRRRGLGSLAILVVAALAGCSTSSVQPHVTAPTAATSATATAPAATASAGGSTSAAGSGTARACVTSAAKGACGPYLYKPITQSDGSNTTVGQDVWSPIPGWSQTLYATNPGDWYVTANMPAGNTAVVSFPNVGESYSEPALSSFSSIYSSFDESMNATSATSAWAAYDIWLNNWNNEVMIQHDFAGNGPCPSEATATFGGSGGVPVQSWDLCQYGSELIWKLTGGNEQSGTVDVLAMLNWLETHKYLPSKSTLTDISYGWEICSTGGKPETFSLSKFTISAPQ